MSFIPINQELHGKKRWVKHSSMLFAKADTVAPLLVNDLAAAAQALPIAFVKNNDSFVLVVVMGLRSGQNLLVTPAGEWILEYMPATYRCSPFELIKTNDSLVLGIDENCISESEHGEIFFDSEGNASPEIIDIFKRVQNINSSREMTQQICSTLSEHDLIKPWSIKLNDGSETTEIAGLYKIDEDAFNSLQDEVFLKLRQNNAIPVVYAQLYSMLKINLLGKLANQMPLIEEEKTETFNFAGL